MTLADKIGLASCILSIGLMIGAHIEGKLSYKLGYVDGYQARITYEQGK